MFEKPLEKARIIENCCRKKYVVILNANILRFSRTQIFVQEKI